MSDRAISASLAAALVSPSSDCSRDAEKLVTVSMYSFADSPAVLYAFSASLLQSLGGDTEAAAKYADMAITDMSDKQKSVRLKRIELYQRCAA